MTAAAHESWTRLQTLLNQLRPGDAITARETIAATQLEPETVDLVLAALTRAELFQRTGETFIRQALIEVPQLPREDPRRRRVNWRSPWRLGSRRESCGYFSSDRFFLNSSHRRDVAGSRVFSLPTR